MALELAARQDDCCQFVQERLHSVEEHMSDLCYFFSLYVSKIAHLRDSGDKLAKALHAFASKELLNRTLQNSLTRFSDVLCALQDYREAEVQRLHHKVIVEFASYSHICKQAKEELKKYLAVVSTDLKKQKRSEKSNDEQKSESKVATMKAVKLIDTLERRKLEDLKRIFLDFIHIELLFHTRTVELFSKAYEEIRKIDTEEDMEEFRSRFRFPCFGPGAGFMESALERVTEKDAKEYQENQPDINCSCSSLRNSDDTKSCSSTDASTQVKKVFRSRMKSDAHGTKLSENGEATKAYHTFKWMY